MAHGAPGPTSFLSTRPSSMFLVVVLAVSAAACLSVDAAHAGRGNPRPTASGGRFLASVMASRRMKGDACRANDSGACGAPSASDGRLECCGGACTDVLSSRSNCGGCGARCSFGQLCCGGRCVDVVYDGENCGACRRACPAGVRCAYGMCGYA
jgi:hypothetical protein